MRMFSKAVPGIENACFEMKIIESTIVRWTELLVELLEYSLRWLIWFLISSSEVGSRRNGIELMAVVMMSSEVAVVSRRTEMGLMR